jgi:hypothetical protein
MAHDTEVTQKKMNENMERMGMRKMKDTSMGMDKAMKEAMMAGTHHMMLDITDSTSGKEIADASAKVLIGFPSKKNWSANLKP